MREIFRKYARFLVISCTIIVVQTNSITTDFGRKPGVNTVLYYSFDNDSASTSFDGASGGYNGTRNSDSGTYESLTKGKCVVLNGTSSRYMRIPTSVPFPTTNFTFSFLVKYTANSTDNSKAIMSKHANGSTNSYLYINEFQGKIRCDIPRKTNDCFVSNNVLNDGKRHHISMIKSGNSRKMYVDNVLNSNKTISQSPTQSTSVQALFGFNNAGNVGFNGLVDEFICENVARSESENTEYFNKIKNRYSIQ